jgi:hypothetical protein
MLVVDVRTLVVLDCYCLPSAGFGRCCKLNTYNVSNFVDTKNSGSYVLISKDLTFENGVFPTHILFSSM